MAKYLYGLIFKNTAERERFMEVVHERMYEEGLDVPTLATEIGYNRKSVYQFFKDTGIANKFMAASIADKLNISKSDWVE